MLKLNQLIIYQADTQEKVIRKAIIKSHHILRRNIKGHTIELVTKLSHITDEQCIVVVITNQATIEDHTTKEPTIEEEDMWEAITTDIIEDTHHQKDTDLHTLLPNILEVNMFHLTTRDQSTLHQSISLQFITQLFTYHPCISHLFTNQNNICHQFTVIVLTHQCWSLIIQEVKLSKKEFQLIQMVNWLIIVLHFTQITTHHSKVWNALGTKQIIWPSMVAPMMESWEHITEPATIDVNRDACKIKNVMPSTFTQTLKSAICWDKIGAHIAELNQVDNRANHGISSNVAHQYGSSLRNQSLVSGQLWTTLELVEANSVWLKSDTMQQAVSSFVTKTENVWPSILILAIMAAWC